MFNSCFNSCFKSCLIVVFILLIVFIFFWSFFNLVLVDEEDRRYFKQSEIDLWPKDLGWRQFWMKNVNMCRLLINPWITYTNIKNIWIYSLNEPGVEKRPKIQSLVHLCIKWYYPSSIIVTQHQQHNPSFARRIFPKLCL